MDENIERRNHYLDLAGIENYASKFDSTGIKRVVSAMYIYIYLFFIVNRLNFNFCF